MIRRAGRLLITLSLVSLSGCIMTTTYEVGVVEEYTRPSDAPIPRPRSTEAARKLEAEWPPATAWEPVPQDEFRITPVYRAQASLPACSTARPDQPCRGVPTTPRVFTADGERGVILRVRSTGAAAPPVIRLDEE